jgi:hypothetical protein
MKRVAGKDESTSNSKRHSKQSNDNSTPTSSSNDIGLAAVSVDNNSSKRRRSGSSMATSESSYIPAVASTYGIQHLQGSVPFLPAGSQLNDFTWTSSYTPAVASTHSTQYLHGPVPFIPVDSQLNDDTSGVHVYSQNVMAYNPFPLLPHEPVEVVHCDGLDPTKIIEYATSTSYQVLHYLHENFNLTNSKVFSHGCSTKAELSSSWEKKGWVRVNRYLLCPSCDQDRHNVDQKLNKLKNLQEKPILASTGSLPSSVVLRATIVYLFNREMSKQDKESSAFQAFESNTEAKENMLILGNRGESLIKTKFNQVAYSIDLCSDCSKMIIQRDRVTNTNRCKSCNKKVVNDRTNYKRRREDDEQRVQPNSKTNYKHLTSDELKTRTKNFKTTESNLRKRVNYLEKQKAVFMANLKAYDDEISFNGSKSDQEIPQDSSSFTDEVIPDQHKTFIEELNQILSSVVQNKKQYQVALRDSLLALLKMGVITEGKGSDYEFQEEDVADLVDAVMEQITNQAKKLNGKESNADSHPKQFNCPLHYGLAPVLRIVNSSQFLLKYFRACVFCRISSNKIK